MRPDPLSQKNPAEPTPGNTPLESPYLAPVLDGLPVRPARSWSEEKLDYLTRYLDAFITSMHGKPWSKIRYLDLFAGPGKCQVGPRVVLGSPLVALTARLPFDEYIFIESSTTDAQALQTRVSHSSRSQSVRVLSGDCNVLVDEISSEIALSDRSYSRQRWSSLNLAFVDPEGLEAQWRTISSLAGSRTDLILYWPEYGLNRNMAQRYQDREDNFVDAFFGSREWRKLYADSAALRGNAARHRILIDHYRERLSSLGYKMVQAGDRGAEEPVMRNTARRGSLYRLILASKHELGHKFWHDVTQRNVHGQQRLL